MMMPSVCSLVFVQMNLQKRPMLALAFSRLAWDSSSEISFFSGRGSLGSFGVLVLRAFSGFSSATSSFSLMPFSALYSSVSVAL